MIKVMGEFREKQRLQSQGLSKDDEIADKQAFTKGRGHACGARELVGRQLGQRYVEHVGRQQLEPSRDYWVLGPNSDLYFWRPSLNIKPPSLGNRWCGLGCGFVG